ncbi:MAG TPA: hypothetical protein VFF06_14240 [Polyangia bacterium]|nr:hypothetical protein [Polyangia bacterium]
MNELEPSTRERAFVVAAVRALGPRAEAFCGRRSPLLRRFAAQLYRDRERWADESQRLSRAVPAGVGEVHPSWYEPPPASTNPAAAAWLSRRAYGQLVDMGEPQAAAGALDRLERRDPDELAELVIALGRRRVAIAFSGAPRAAVAQLCARLGEPAASELLAQVRAVAPSVGSDEVHAAQRALFGLGPAAALTARPTDDRESRGISSGSEARALFSRAGCGWLAPALFSRGGDRLRRVSQRLPRPLGEQLLASATVPSTDAEHSSALTAASALLTRPRRR